MFSGKNRVRKLLADYLQDDLTPERLDEAIREILNDSNSRIIEEIADKTLRSKETAALADRGKFDERFRRLMEIARATGTGKSEEEPIIFTRKTRVLSLWTTIGAVASVILLLAIGGLWMKGLLDPDEKQGMTAQINVDLEPGSEKAVLTLSDGSTVILDTAGNGLLARQSNTDIIKLADGQIGYASKGRESLRIIYNTITTPRGGEYSVILPDSSRVWLNAESSIRFPVAFSGRQRAVEITGEAYFEVVKDQNMPFVVSVNGINIEVLGTSFNVRAYSDEEALTATLVTGSIKVASQANKASLVPGQQARADNTGLIEISDDADIEEIIAWKNGFFIFNSDDIEEIMGQIGRWYDVEVTYDGVMTDETFSGIISRRSKVSQVLQLLEPYGIKFTVTDDMITVSTQ